MTDQHDRGLREGFDMCDHLMQHATPAAARAIRLIHADHVDGGHRMNRRNALQESAIDPGRVTVGVQEKNRDGRDVHRGTGK